MRMLAVAILALGICGWSQAQPPIGKWIVHANGQEGELHIVSVKNGKVEGKLIGAPIAGFYDEKTKCLSVFRVGVNGVAVQSYKGYLSSNNDLNQVRYTLSGTFQVFTDEAGTGTEFGWYAVTARAKK